MKRTFGLLVLGFVAVLTNCSSLGVATSGAKYFDGKNEDKLVKYFGYSGSEVKSTEEYDKAIYFTNLVSTIYVDKTTVQKFKNKRYSNVSEFSFKQLADGCLLYDNTIHVQTERITQHTGGTVEIINKEYHKNDNAEINSKLKSFNDNINQYKAVRKSDDGAMFNGTDIGGEYYVYNIEKNTLAYNDEKLGNSTAIYYKYGLQKVSVYEDSKSSTETHTAYIYNDRTKTYTDEKGNQITQDDAFANEKKYLAQGFKSRKKDKGVAFTAYIKDGVVAKVEPVN